MSWLEVLLAVILGLLVNEVCDVSPWAAKRAVRWAARRWSQDPVVAADYAEEWQAVVNDCPGKLFKLFMALGFVVGAIGLRLGSAVRRRRARIRWALRGITPMDILWYIASIATLIELIVNSTIFVASITGVPNSLMLAILVACFALATIFEIRRIRRIRKVLDDLARTQGGGS